MVVIVISEVCRNLVNSRRVRVEFMCFMIIVKLVIFAKVVGCQQFRTREVNFEHLLFL